MKTGIIILSLFLAAALYGAPCGTHGSAQPGTREYDLNAFKNRSQAPSTINPSITLEALAQGARFENTEAASIALVTLRSSNLAARKPAIAVQQMQRTLIRTSRSSQTSQTPMTRVSTLSLK